jgi:hypothetical protein
VVAELHRHHAVALHHRLGGLDRIGKERLEVRVGARAIHEEADVQVAGGRGDRRCRAGFGEIDSQRAGLDRGAGVDLGRNLIEYRLPARQQRNVDAALSKSRGERGSEPVGGTCDERPRSVLGCECHWHSSCLADRSQAHLGVSTACDAPTGVGADDLVVVETDRVDAGFVVAALSPSTVIS